MATGAVYMRINKHKLDIHKSFGFQRVTPEELHDIVQRLQNGTYNTKLYRGERHQVTPCPPRTPAVKCDKAKNADTGEKVPVTSRTEREITRTFYRLQRCETLSIKAGKGKILPQHERIANINKETEREKAIEQARDKKMKWLRRLRRPTTATKQRHFCWFCDDPKLCRYLEYDFSDDRVVSKGELNTIVQRVQTPTKASLMQVGLEKEASCPKRRDSISSRCRSQTPLLSGLERSKNVDKIVSRLYPGRPHSSPAGVSHEERRRFRNNVTRPSSCMPRSSEVR